MGNLKVNCLACNSSNHLINKCEKVHLIIDDSFIIKKYLYSEPVIDRTKFTRKKTKSTHSFLVLHKFFKSISEADSYYSEEEIGTNHLITQNSSDLDQKNINYICFRNSKIESNANSLKSMASDLDKNDKFESYLSMEKKDTNFIKKNSSISPTLRPALIIENKENKLIKQVSNIKFYQTVQESLFDYEFEKMKNYKIYFPESNGCLVVSQIKSKNHSLIENFRKKKRKTITKIK